MRRQYHYVVSGLPELVFDDNKLSYDSAEFREMLSEFLSAGDMDIIRLYFWRYDNLNVLAKLKDGSNKTDKRGNLSEKETEELILAVKEGSFSENSFAVPAYFGKLTEAYRNESPVIPGKSWELQFSELYFEHAVAHPNHFVSNWFLFERDLNNLLTAAKCKKYNVSPEGQLIGSNEFVDKLTRSSSKDFSLDNEFPYLDQILKTLDEEDFLDQEKRTDRIKWEYLDEHVFFHYFTIEKIFSFLIRLSIVERWLSLDKETGQKLFDELIGNMETSYEFPEEFQLK
jgi:hypothetical protein